VRGGPGRPCPAAHCRPFCSPLLLAGRAAPKFLSFGPNSPHPDPHPHPQTPPHPKVALGIRPFLRVFGNDYDTPDGTPVRDYIHVMDLAEGHVAALDKLLKSPGFGCQAVNLGTGKGTTVLEMVASFEKASGAKVPYKVRFGLVWGGGGRWGWRRGGWEASREGAFSSAPQQALICPRRGAPLALNPPPPPTPAPRPPAPAPDHRPPPRRRARGVGGHRHGRGDAGLEGDAQPG
jgi:hypothetical protein